MIFANTFATDAMIATIPNAPHTRYKIMTASRLVKPWFEMRCDVWSLPGVVSGFLPRRNREMTTRVMSNNGNAITIMGTSHDTFWLCPRNAA